MPYTFGLTKLNKKNKPNLWYLALLTPFRLLNFAFSGSQSSGHTPSKNAGTEEGTAENGKNGENK